MSLTMRHLPFTKFRENDGDYEAIANLVSASIATAAVEAGHEVAPYLVYVTPVRAVSDDSTQFYATIMPRREEVGEPCALSATLQSVSSGDSLKGTTSSLANDAKLSTASGSISVADVLVPAKSILCSEFKCRKSYPLAVPPGTLCRGFLCTTACCEQEWSDAALPLEGTEATGDLKKIASGADDSKEGALPSLENLGFTCLESAACAGKDAALDSKEQARNGSLKDCKDACAAAESCTGVTYVKRSGACIFYGEHMCDPESSDTLGAGKTTCVKAKASKIPNRGLEYVASSLDASKRPWEKPVEEALKKVVQKAKESHGADQGPPEDVKEGVTASFVVQGVTYSKEQHQALAHAIKKAVAFVSRAEDSQLTVAIKAGTSARRLRDDGGAQGSGGLLVLVTLTGCGSCSEQRTALLDSDSATVIATSIQDASQDGSAQVVVLGAKSPSEPTQCDGVQCAAMLWNADPTRSCGGGGCSSTCCAPRTCAQTDCPAPFIRNVYNGDKTYTTQGEFENLCCVVRCSEYTCPSESCPVPDALEPAPASQADEKCCRKRACCSAPIAECASCWQCQQRQAYCSMSMHKFSAGRRLSALGANVTSFSNNIFGSRVNKARRLKGSALPAGDAMKRIERSTRSSEHRILKKKNKVTSPVYKDVAEKYNQVVNEMISQTHGRVAGCQKEISIDCEYKLKSVFVLHKEFGEAAAEATAVQVLTDTQHAVSCGSDGICWVWDIRSALPVSAFPDQAGRVNAISVLYDATYVLTSGDDGNGGGVAYLWDWAKGFQFKSWTCKQQFLSSAEFPAWRIFGLGCADNFTTLHNWDTGTSVRLPFNSQTIAEVEARIQGKVDAYEKTRMNGIERLAADMEGKSTEFVKEMIMAQDPDILSEEMKGENIYNMAHANTFGAVNAIAYMPSNLNFATGHEDGKVRYWSAATGMLEMVSSGHQGPVRALAAFPTKQILLSGGEDGTVRVWNLEKGPKFGYPIQTFGGKKEEFGSQRELLYQPVGGPITSLAIFPDGKRVAVASKGKDQGGIRIWNIEGAVLLCTISAANGVAINALAINPSNPAGQIIAASEDGYVSVYDPH